MADNRNETLSRIKSIENPQPVETLRKPHLSEEQAAWQQKVEDIEKMHALGQPSKAGLCHFKAQSLQRDARRELNEAKKHLPSSCSSATFFSDLYLKLVTLEINTGRDTKPSLNNDKARERGFWFTKLNNANRSRSEIMDQCAQQQKAPTIEFK